MASAFALGGRQREPWGSGHCRCGPLCWVWSVPRRCLTPAFFCAATTSRSIHHAQHRQQVPNRPLQAQAVRVHVWTPGATANVQAFRLKLDPSNPSLSNEQLATLKHNVQLMRDAIVLFTATGAARGVSGHTGTYPPYLSASRVSSLRDADTFVF